MIDFLKSDKFILPIVYIILGIVFQSVVRYLFNKIIKNRRVDKKKKTILSLIKNIVKYLVYIFVVLSILSVYGVNTNSILASLGIVGLVIGLALQDILADFLSGIYILFDNHYTIGDTVLINGFKGEVISFGLMSTKIKNAYGDILIIANSSFKEVINYSISNTNLLIDLDVGYDTDIDYLESALKSIKSEVLKMDNVCDYALLGVNEFSSSSIKYLVKIECRPNQQYQVKRDYLKIIKKLFDEKKIEIPYNKMDINIRSNHE